MFELMNSTYVEWQKIGNIMKSRKFINLFHGMEAGCFEGYQQETPGPPKCMYMFCDIETAFFSLLRRESFKHRAKVGFSM